MPGALPGSSHDLTCARIWGIVRELSAAGLIDTALQVQRLTLGGRGLGNLLVSTGLSGGLVRMAMLAAGSRPGLPLSTRPAPCTPH